MLALFAAGVGLFYQNEGKLYTFTTLHGETVQVWGQGWYHHDSPIAAVGFMAADLVTLLLAIPLLLISTTLYRRGSFKSGPVLTGALAYFLYNYGSLSFGASNNNLFIVYVAIFSASLFAFVLALASFDLELLPSHFY